MTHPSVIKSYSETPLTEWVGISLTAITTVIMAYSTLFSIFPILLMYACWLPHILFKYKLVFSNPALTALPLIFSLYCLLSFLWSDYPSISLYSGIQFLSMIICCVIMARVVNVGTFIKGLSIGSFCVLLVLFKSGSFSFDGLFGSKNQVGFFAQVGIFTALLSFFAIKGNIAHKIMFGIIPFMLASLCLALSHSVSSVISVITLLGVTLGVYLIGKTNQGTRAVLIFMALFTILTISILIYAFNIDIQGEVLEFFGKDRTLTGRTELWAYGIQYWQTHPVLGDGYNAFWVQGRSEAEALWEEFYISVRSGFHFHNVFIQTLVDLGAVGAFIMLGLFLSFLIRGTSALIHNGGTLNVVFGLGVFYMFASRALVENDILGPFGIGVLLFYSTLIRSFKRNATPTA